MQQRVAPPPCTNPPRRARAESAGARALWLWLACGGAPNAIARRSGPRRVDRRLVAEVQPRLGDLAVTHAHHVHLTILQGPSIACPRRVDQRDGVIIVGKYAVGHRGKRAARFLEDPSEQAQDGVDSTVVAGDPYRAGMMPDRVGLKRGRLQGVHIASAESLVRAGARGPVRM